MSLAGSTCWSTTPRTSGRRRLHLLGDTDCEDLERALATNLLGPFRLTKAVLGALAASAREGRGAVVLNVSSDAAINAYPRWGAYGASKAALRHLSAIWDAELAADGVRFLSLDPGDMDTPLHAAAVPDADRATAEAARRPPRVELADAIGAALPGGQPAARHHAAAIGRRRLMIAARRSHPPSAAGEAAGGQLRAGRSPTPLGPRLSISCGPATWWSPTTPRPYPPASTVSTCRAAALSRCGSPVGARSRRTISAGFPPSCSARATTARAPRTVPRRRPSCRAIDLSSGRSRRPSSGCSATRVSCRCASTARRTPSGPAWRDMAGRSSTRTSPCALALWDVWTSIAGPPVAFEPPSAGFALDWRALSAAMRGRGVAFATITHAAGISSTGDEELDRRLPFDEPYRIPPATAAAIRRMRARGGRIVAIGTTVVRALEHAATRRRRVQAGEGLATQRIGPATGLRVVDAILSGTHEPGTSHYELLRAFTDDATLAARATNWPRATTARTNSAIPS